MEKLWKARLSHILGAIWRYLVYFLLVCFVITCCMDLFLHTMTKAMNLELTEADIGQAAKLTFINVVFLCFLWTAADVVRRRIMVTRPIRNITDGAKKVMEGDFSVHIPQTRSLDPNDGFSIIIDYFNRMVAELGGMETLRTDFIANVSHELKTPLSVIQNYGTLLQQTNLPEEKRLEYARIITETSRNLANMVSNILKLNKLENQNIYPSQVSYNLGEQLCECLLTFEDAWEEKRLEIETSLEDDVIVVADPELLSLVWNNLFSNAVKFTEPGGRISLELKTQGDTAMVTVSDTGCGISAETGKHIFEKFYQGDTSHATRGNGLGLALVKRVVDITGGDISVESEVGKGSAFTVTIRRRTDGNG